MQYFTKTGGNVTVINSEFICDSDSLNLMWSYNKKDLSTCYQYGNKLNGKPFQINSYTAYSSCNILSSNLSNYLSDSENPTQILLHPVYSEILSGKDSVIINASLKGFMDKNISGNITWSLSDKTAAKIIESDNNQCIITGLNDTDWHNEITLKAVSASGAVAYAKINIKPEMLPSPRFISNPEIRKHPGGYLKIDYKLNLGTRKDHSNILWYRCTDINGANPRLVASSTMNNPESVYYLQEGDEGYYMMASISPKHIRSEGGLPKNVVMRSPIKKGDILRSDIYTNFHNFPTIYQPEIIPGFWTVDAYKIGRAHV